MRTENHLRILAVIAAMGVIHSAEAKKKQIDLSEFEGRYRAKSALIVYDGAPYPATADIKVTVPRSGTSARVTIRGFLTAGGIQYPFSNTFTLKRNGALDLADIFFFIEGPTGPASGKYKGKGGGKIPYSVVYAPAPEVPMSGEISVDPRRKKKLDLLFEIVVTGSAYYRFDFEAIAR